MKIRCEAIVENPMQRENLKQCIIILGGKPEVANDKVSVEYEGEKQETIIELFEHYTRHSITSI